MAAAYKPAPGSFKVPWKTDTPAARANRVLDAPLHDPRAPGAVVLYECKDVFSKNKIAVVVDPVVGLKLRPHQVLGVKFMFDCVMGFKGFKGNGCILADDMGLGKTIQAVALVWTLLNQSPTGKPAVRRVLIVCPSSLVMNWVNEFNKWLGPGQVNAIPFGDSNKKKVKEALAKWQYTHDPAEFVLVASYDQMRINIGEISKVEDLDLIVCDEGHRLKNANIKSSQALNSLKTTKRVILSGTPIQNDLEEFHAMVSFVNPNILRELNVFKAVFADQILAMREPDCEPEVRAQGKLRSAELSRMTGEFILRRTSQVNKKYLPAKIDHVVFIKLNDFQRQIYRTLCQAVKDRDEDSKTSLALVTDLKKLCNDPALIYENYQAKFKWPKMDPKQYNRGMSSKMLFIENLLARIKANKDKVVIVSNYTQTLEILAKMCITNEWRYFQLDGSTKVSNRQILVDKFNNPASPEFVFLLSSKAGGCGLNLVGASSLIMADPDWNPANDAQAMARVWRPGQTKKVFLYRLLCTGTIEEKIFQRQVAKLSLADTVVNSNADSEPNFSANELKELFMFKEETISETHDLLNCKCAGTIQKVAKHIRDRMKVDALDSWEHFADIDKIQHPFFHGSKDLVSFVFLKEADPAKEAEEEERTGKKVEDKIEEKTLNFEAEEDVMADLPEEKKGAKASGENSSSSSSKKRKKSKRDEYADDEMELDDGWVAGENEEEDGDFRG